VASDFSAQLHMAGAHLRAMSRQVRSKTRPALKKAAEPMVAQARSNASWSTRIPGAIRLAVTARGVDIRVSSKKAPHARPYEGIGGNATFRHPVMGNRDRWVSQDTRPFLMPAVRQHRRKVRAALIQVVQDAATAHGYK
jgi:hypothetical protein